MEARSKSKNQEPQSRNSRSHLLPRKKNDRLIIDVLTGIGNINRGWGWGPTWGRGSGVALKVISSLLFKKIDVSRKLP